MASLLCVFLYVWSGVPTGETPCRREGTCKGVEGPAVDHLVLHAYRLLKAVVLLQLQPYPHLGLGALLLGRGKREGGILVGN